MTTTNYSNCKVDVDEKGILTAVIDLNKPVGLSASKKSINFGTTGGNKAIVYKDQILKLGINCYVKNPDYVQTAEDKAKMKEIFSQ